MGYLVTCSWKCPKSLCSSPCLSICYLSLWGFPGGSDGKESACNVGDPGSVPRLGRSHGEGMATHSSILAWRIPWTGAWRATVHGVAELDMTKRLTHIIYLFTIYVSSVIYPSRENGDGGVEGDKFQFL